VMTESDIVIREMSHPSMEVVAMISRGSEAQPIAWRLLLV